MDDVRAKTEALNQVIMSRNREVKQADRAKQEAATSGRLRTVQRKHFRHSWKSKMKS